MLDPHLLRDLADRARDARDRLAAAASVSDPIEQLITAGPIEGARLTAVIRAELHFARAAAELARAARLTDARQPMLIVEVLS